VYGSTVFMEGNTEVIATADAVQFMKKDFGWLAEYHNRSRHIQFGDIAPEYAPPGVSFSTTRLPPFSSEEHIVFPTKTFDPEYAFLLGGKRFELYHTTGETPDHLMVWLPDERALFCGDLYYLSFPQTSTAHVGASAGSGLVRVPRSHDPPERRVPHPRTHPGYRWG